MEPQVIMDFISNQGLAVGLSVYLVVVVNKTLQKNTEVLNRIASRLDVK